MKGKQVHDKDLHGSGKRDGLVKMEDSVNGGSGCDSNTMYEAMKMEGGLVGGGDEWLEREHEDLLDVDDTSIFYGDFPPLFDFPCMSSSSSSSSTRAPVNLVTCSSSSSVSSSSSSASWAKVKSDAEGLLKKNNNNQNQYGQMDETGAPALMSTASMEILPSDHHHHHQIDDVDCVDIMEELADMDLLDTDYIWDPSSVFPYETTPEEDQQEQIQQQQKEQQHHQHDQQHSSSPSEDLAMVFLEWLKSNKETISAEDLRGIKLKRSTIESAARRLGGGKEGMKELLKLILEWVQNHHLHRKRMKEGEASPTFPTPQQNFPKYSKPNPNFNCNSLSPDPTPCFFPAPISSMPWIPSHPTYVSGHTSGFPSMVGYMGDPVFSNSAAAAAPFNHNSAAPYSPASEYQMFDTTWGSPHFGLSAHYSSFQDQGLNTQTPPSFAAFASQYPCHQLYQGHGGERPVRLGSSATKEARKKRMARQRRFLSHHRSNQNHQVQQHQHTTIDQHARLVNDGNCATTAQANPGNSWVFWSSGGGSISRIPASDATLPPVADRPTMHAQQYQRQIASDKRQGWKPEKNLRFLLQKVLKQSDVGNLGRIVLPKKEAETHLPELEARDGISIAMEDIGTSRVWNMRYRFWPNNKSRMYLLENTGDFVRSNGLQEGDFIVIYSDVKCGKYMIRGVKVRQPGLKSEAKRGLRMQRNLHATSTAGDGSSPSSIKEACMG